MPKKKRIKVSTLSKKEALEIGEEVISKISSKSKKETPSKRFNIRIPNDLYERLELMAKKSGLAKSAIIIGGLNTALNRMEKE